MATPRPTEPTKQIVKHPGCPQWGLGFLVEERDDKRFYDFEDGQLHSIAKAFWSKLEPVELAAAEAEALEAKIKSLREKAVITKKPRGRPQPVVHVTFEEQVARFQEELPGGFTGDAYIAQERGTGEDGASTEGLKKKQKALKADAIAAADRLLVEAELKALLDGGKADEFVARIKKLHQASTGLLHPLGDLIPFGKMPADHNKPFAEACFDLLFGDGEFSSRFDRYVEVLAVDKLNTWPLATILPALRFPREHVFVKPSFYEKQAAVLGFDLGYERLPVAAVYERMLRLARLLQERLTEGGLVPRDFMDVYTFIARTITPPKPPPAPKAQPAAPPR
jgi:hypothetical protein